MKLAKGLLKDCSDVEVTLDETAAPDYYMSLNIEAKSGFIIQGELSQLMVVNARKSPIYSDEASTGRLVKRACKTIVADWQAHGQLVLPPPAAPVPPPVRVHLRNRQRQPPQATRRNMFSDQQEERFGYRRAGYAREAYTTTSMF